MVCVTHFIKSGGASYETGGKFNNGKFKELYFFSRFHWDMLRELKTTHKIPIKAVWGKVCIKTSCTQLCCSSLWHKK